MKRATDDLKYHGPREHRGTRTFNFFDGNRENTAPPNLCNNKWGRCLDNSDVNCFLVTWIYDTNQITFTIKAYLERDQWVGIGFNENPTMAGTDVIVGWRTENGEAVIQDRKATAYAQPPLDSQQDATLISSSRVDSVTTLNFSRPLITNDKDDISLSYNCVHFIYAKGGKYSSNSISYHDNTPIISTKKICIPCTGVEEPSTTSTEVPASQRTNVRSEFKITNTPWDSKLGDATSQEFRTLADKLHTALLSLLTSIPGFVDVKILRFRRGSVIVEFDVIMAGDEGAVAQGSTAALEKLRTEGQLAEFTVDKDSVKLVPAKAPDEKSTLTVTLILIIAISAAGVLLILVLGICNCIRNRQQTEKQNTPDDYVPMNTTAGNRNTDSMKLSYEEWSKQQQEYNNPTFDNATYTGLGGQSSDNLVSKDGSGTKEQGTFIRHFCE